MGIILGGERQEKGRENKPPMNADEDEGRMLGFGEFFTAHATLR